MKTRTSGTRVAADDVQVEFDDGMLTISGERRGSHEENQEGFYRSERSYGSFTRSIALPEGIDEDKVKASFDNGVLEVKIPILGDATSAAPSHPGQFTAVARRVADRTIGEAD